MELDWICEVRPIMRKAVDHAQNYARA